MKQFKGFTLIELLVVIAIIAILASIVLASLNSARVKSRDARRIADLKQLALALELYNNDNSGYPAAPGTGGVVNTTNLPNVSPNYISVLPTDPINTGANVYNYESLTGTGAPSTWTACTTGPCSHYALEAQLEGTLGAGIQSALTTTKGAAVCANANTYCLAQ